MPVSLIEAIACGANCLASDVRGNRDLLSSDNLCKSNDEDEWIKLLEKVFCCEIQENRLKDVYCIDEVKNKLRKIYELD